MNKQFIQYDYLKLNDQAGDIFFYQNWLIHLNSI